MQQQFTAYWRLWVLLAVFAAWGGNQLCERERMSVAFNAIPQQTAASALDSAQTEALFTAMMAVRPDKASSFENFPANLAIFRWVSRHHQRLLDYFFLLIVFAGTPWILLPALVGLVLVNRQRITPLLLSMGFVILLVNIILKPLTDQPRPMALLVLFDPLLQLRTHSFPSGDAAQAFAIAVILLRGQRWWVRGLLLGYAALVAYERMYVGVHFPLDVLSGAVIGIGCALAADWLLGSFGGRSLWQRLRPAVTVGDERGQKDGAGQAGEHHQQAV